MKSITLIFVFFFYNLFTTNLVAQTKLAGARSWQTVSSLLGKTIGETKELLQKHGLVSYEKTDLWGNKMFNFYPVGTDAKYANGYWAVVRKDTVICMDITYIYPNRVFENDINEIKNNLTQGGYLFKEKKGEKPLLEGYIYQLEKKSSAVIIVGATLQFVIGDPALVKFLVVSF